jgi:plastocyanin
MRSRGLLKGLVALALGAAVAALPAVAGSETAPTIEAINHPGGIYGETHEWAPPSATVGANGVVAFVNNSSTVPHSVVWSSAIKPACEHVPEAGATQWSGTCTFSQPGTYTFYCSVHPNEMKGSITVNANGTTTATMTAGGTTTSTTTSGSSTSQGPPVPGTSPLQGKLTLAKSQRGTSVRGSVHISPAGAGGRLEVDLLARRASLASASGAFRARVGRLVRGGLHAGKFSFSVPLNAKGRRALRRHGHLGLSAVVQVSAPAAATVSQSRSIVLRRR